MKLVTVQSPHGELLLLVIEYPPAICLKPPLIALHTRGVMVTPRLQFPCPDGTGEVSGEVSAGPCARALDPPSDSIDGFTYEAASTPPVIAAAPRTKRRRVVRRFETLSDASPCSRGRTSFV